MRCGSKSQADKERYFKWVVDLPDIYDNSKYQARAYIWGAGVKVTLKEVEVTFMRAYLSLRHATLNARAHTRILCRALPVYLYVQYAHVLSRSRL